MRCSVCKCLRIPPHHRNGSSKQRLWEQESEVSFPCSVSIALLPAALSFQEAEEMEPGAGDQSSSGSAPASVAPHPSRLQLPMKSGSRHARPVQPIAPVENIKEMQVRQWGASGCWWGVGIPLLCAPRCSVAGS